MPARRRSRFVLGCSGLAVSLVISGVLATTAPAVAEGAASPSLASAAVAGAEPAGPAEGESSEQAQALTQARDTGKRVEVVGARTETETVLANPAGTLTRRISSEPVRVREADGDLVDIDTTLRATGSTLETTATPSRVQLSDTGSGELLAKVSSKESDLSVGLGYRGDLGSPEVDGGTATYTQDGDTSVRVTAGDDGFAAHVLLDAVPEDAAPVYRFPLQVEGARARLVSRTLEFVDAEGEVVGESSMLRMWDSQTDEFGDPANVAPVEAALTESNGSQVLELRPSPEFLADPETVYPVTVDPDISLTPGFDTYVTDEHPYDAFASDWSLRVGSNDGTNRNRSVISFPTGAIAGQTVTKATLRLFQYGAGNCDPRRVDALIRTTGWSVPDFYEQLINGVSKHSWVAQGATVAPDSRFASSDSFNASAAGGGTPNCGGPSWQTIDLTPQTSAWAGLIQEDFGVMLKTPEARERNTNFEKRFCAENPNNTGSGYCQSDRKPELQITYTPELGDQSWYSTSKHKLDERSTLKVNHRSGNTYISANDASVSSLGMDLTLARRYNSRAGTPGQFGPKWTLSGGPDVWLEKIDQWRYVYHTPDGAELGPFVRNADTEPEDGYDKFTTPVGGLGADLKDNTNDTFTLTFHKSQKKYTFTAMGGDGDLFHTKTADRSGNTTTYDYVSGTQRLDSVTDTAGRAYQISYATSGSAAGMIDQISDANGPTTRTWSYGYTDGRLTSYTDPEGDTTSYAWGLGSTEATEPGPEGEVIETITDPPNDSGYSPEATLVTEDGETTTTDYAGGPDSDPVGYTFSYQDNPLPTVCENDDERSATVLSDEISMGETYYCFTARTNGDLNDSANNKLTTVVDAQGDTRSQSYSADNQPEVFTDSSGSTVNTYGNAGSGLMDQLRKTDSAKDTGDTETNTSASDEGASKTYKYGADSSIPGSKYLPTSVVDGNNDCTAYGYDGQGRQNRTWVGRNPDNNNRCDQSTGGLLYQANYNNDGTVAWMSDPNANNDGANPTQAQKTIYTYWQSGQTGFVPGTTGQMKTMRRPGGDCASGSSRSLCTAFTYDGLARTLTTADGRGVATRSRYDTMDRTTESLANGATSCQPASGECITYDYDAAGNLIERQDQQGATTFGYDRLNRKITQSTPDGVSIDYGYNQDSRMTTLTQNLPGQSPDTVTYNYDTAGDLNAVLDADGKIDISYDNNHRLQSTVFRTSPKLTRIERTYTNAGMPRRLIVRSGTSTYDGMVDYRYVWSENGKDTDQLQKLFVTNGTSAINYKSTFAYTNRGQLTSETRENGGGASSSFTYDNAGNLATATRGGNARHYGYDQANQLCWTGTSDGTSPVATCPSSAPGSSQSVARDAAGNSEGDPTASIDYNARSQAETIAGQDQGYYDQGNDLRVTTGSTHLVHTRTGITARTTDTDGTGTPTGPDAETTFYTRMPDGRLLSARGPDGTFFYITDHHKTVLGLVDATGARAGTYRYDPYGEPTLVEGTTAEQSNPFRWISGYQNNTDQPGGYYKLGARYYNPTTGAFTQPDPEPGNMGQPLRLNSYLYSGGDPINNMDASGRWWVFDDPITMTAGVCAGLVAAGCLNANLQEGGDFSVTASVGTGLGLSPSFYPGQFGDTSSTSIEACYWVCGTAGPDVFGVGIGTPGFYEQEMSWTLLD